MERMRLILLAILVVAGALLGLRFLSPTVAPDLTAQSADTAASSLAPGGLRDRKLPAGRVAISGGEREEQKAPPAVPPPGEERRGVRGGSSGPTTSGGSAELIAGVERRRGVLGAAQNSGGFGAADDAAVGGLTDLALAGRSAAVPPSAKGREENLPPADINKRQTLEFVDAPKPGGSDDVLLSIPFKGAVDAEVGGGAIASDGLVSHGGQVEFPDNAQLSFPVGNNVNSEAGTISFEFRPEWAGGDDTNNSLVQIRDEHTWENSLGIVNNFGNLRFVIHDSSGVERNVGMEIHDWPAGEQQQITATWNATTMSLYVNGSLVGQAELANPINFGSTTPIHIGSDFPGSAYSGAGGTISNFTVYGRALGADEVASR